jgi:hypothetical protein
MASDSDELSQILAQITICLLRQNSLNALVIRALMELSKNNKEALNRIGEAINANGEISESNNKLVDQIKSYLHE